MKKKFTKINNIVNLIPYVSIEENSYVKTIDGNYFFIMEIKGINTNN
jgi:hypothetical protein